MKKLLLTMMLVVTFFAFSAVSASAVVNETVKVGLRYGSSAMFSANLENAVGAGYAFGYYDEDLDFEVLGETDETTISMTAAGDIYMSGDGTYSPQMPSGGSWSMGAWRVEIGGFGSFEEAEDAAREYGGWPAWVDWEYVVRTGCYDSRSEAEDAADRMGDGRAVKASSTGVVVTVTRTRDILFEFDCGGEISLGIRPAGRSRETATWFRGYKYPGGFEYSRSAGGNLCVVNVVGLEDYVKGVIPYEMNGDWPLAALEAQAVCARTYVVSNHSHGSDGFDVCSGTHCQVYYGVGSGGAGPTALTDRAVENTEGECLYYDGRIVQDAVYHSSNGGATEDAANVWGGGAAYLMGKEDPYESRTTIPNYSWSVTYTAEELSWILEQKDYSVGTVRNVYVSQYTPLGNVQEVTFEGSRGEVSVSGEACRTIFYSSTYNKSVRSMRFSINGGGPVSGEVVTSDGSRLGSLDGVFAVSGDGDVTRLEGGSVSVISSDGVSKVSSKGSAKPSSSKDGTFTITGTGNGHNIGMSQYGAKAMAELGYDYEEILTFYYTDITVR